MDHAVPYAPVMKEQMQDKADKEERKVDDH